MGLKTEGFETQGNNTAITQTNSIFGGGVSANSMPFKASTDQKWNGAASLRIEATTSATVIGNISVSGTTLAVRSYHRFDMATTANGVSIAAIRNAGGNCAQITQNTDGTLRSTYGTGGTTGTTGGSPGSLTWFRLEQLITPGSTTSSGKFRWAWYWGNDLVAQYDSGDLGGLNLGGSGGAALSLVRLGKNGAAGTVVGNIDDIAVDDTATAFLGPSAAPATEFFLTSGGLWSPLAITKL